MRIGKAKRVYRVEPLHDPVPGERRPPEREPERKPERPLVVKSR